MKASDLKIYVERHTCWELYRKRPVNGGLQSSSYFDVETFKRVLGDVVEETAA